MSNPQRLSIVLSAAIALLLPGAVAQTVAPKAPDEPIEISPFTVVADKVDGYIASESVTGSRVATPIKDLPFTVNVMTSEFLNDFDFFDIDSNAAYTSSFSGLDTQGNYNLRGFGATFQLRNGFYRLGLVDRVNVDRIEIIKGPNAAIYGQTSPAGLVNIITKRPETKQSQRLAVTGGSNNLVRAEANVGGSIGHLGGVALSQMFSASAMNREDDAPYANLRQRAVSEAILAQLNKQSSLLLEYEYSERKSVAAVTSVPWVVTKVGTRYVYTPELVPELGNFNQSGPNGRQDRDMNTVTATYENRLTQVWSTRVSAYWYARDAFNFNSSAGDQYDPLLHIITSRNPVRSILNEDGGAVQADLLAHYHTNAGKLEHKTLVTFDWSTNWRYRFETKPRTAVIGSTDVNVLNPNFDIPPEELWNVITRNDHTRNDVIGVYLRQQTAMFQGRLLAFGGVRYDHVTFDLEFGDQFNVGGSKPGSLNNPGAKDYFTDDAVSPSVGVNYKITPQLAAFANYSKSFFPNAQSSKLGDPRLPNERAEGYDFGIKASYFGDRLVFTLSGFAITRNGVKATVVENGTAVDQAVGQQKADGVEFDFTWRITDDLTMLGGYGYTDARISANGRDTDSVGRRPNGVPQDNGGLALRYRLPGKFDGFLVTLGVKYLGEANPNSLATVSGGNPDLARRNTVVPSSTTVDAGIGYRWRHGGTGTGHMIRFSVRNLFDEEYLTPNKSVGESRQFYLAYTLNH
jgi:outer membrane receptor protein involved in Fe transport